MDLQETTRRDDVFNDLVEMHSKLNAISVFPSLMWLWAFDVLEENFRLYSQPGDDWQEYTTAQDVTLKTIFDKFWNDVEQIGLHMDLGGEVIQDVLFDWMIDNDFLVLLDEDGWLNDENSGEESDNN